MAKKLKPLILPDLFTEGYYKLPSNQVVNISYDTGVSKFAAYSRVIYAKSLQGAKLKLPPESYAGAIKVKYKPSIRELWELAKTAPPITHAGQAKPTRVTDPIIWFGRFIFFFEKMIEFKFIKFDTLGYYDFEGEQDTHLRSSAAYKLAEIFYTCSSLSWNGPSKKIRLKKFLKDIEDWTNNHPKENPHEFILRCNYIQGLRPLTISTECGNTGECFNWGFKGKTQTLMPVERILKHNERVVRIKHLKAELKKLRSRKSHSDEETKRKDLLAKVFEEPNGWIYGYDLIHLEAAKPFTDKYADPKTGLLPKAVVEIDIPTGELVFANHFFPMLKEFPKSEAYSAENSVSHSVGRNNNIFFHAKVNQAFYVPLSNNSPTVWQNKKDPTKLRVGRAFEEPQKGEWDMNKATRYWYDRGHICTDLWAFHACDRSRLPKKIEIEHFSVKVKPGRYRLINHFEHKDAENGIFCEIQRVKGDKLLRSKLSEF